MEQKNFKTVLTEERCITIPDDVYDKLKLKTGDTLSINYEQHTEAIERCLFIENHQDKDGLDAYMCIPKAILEECNLPLEENDLHMLCFDEEITVITGDKMLDSLPAVMIKLCNKLDIPKEIITKFIAEECCGDE